MAVHAGEKDMTTAHLEAADSRKDSVYQPEALQQVEDALCEIDSVESIETRKLIRKVHLRLIPTLAFLYAIALIDRGNLPNARLAEMDR